MRFTRRFVVAGVLSAWVPELARAADRLRADRIVVIKSERRLDLLKDGQVIRSYPVRLGRHPVGPKIFQFDGRTPEGVYTIDRRSRVSAFHLALHISYPQADNVARAAKYNLPAGGAIFIHGTPGTDKRFERDWTDGCIAVSNRAIEEIWTLVDNGTPIEIRP